MQVPFVIDIGCNDGTFLDYLKNDPKKLKFAIGIDKDKQMLKKANMLFNRNRICYSRYTRDFYFFLKEEDVTNLSPSFIEKYKNCPFVTMLELIEHLEPSDVDKAMKCVFGDLSPQYVFLTTPNSEYNPIISESYEKPKNYGTFRHADHKFEWTRAQFSDWAAEISKKYNYQYFLEGIGRVVSGNDDGTRGCASHSALFIRNEIIVKDFEMPKEADFTVKIEVRDEEAEQKDVFRMPIPNMNDNLPDDKVYSSSENEQ